MKIHESSENYLEAILILSQRNGHVHAIDIAAELNFSKPSVSIAMKKLRENGYIAINEQGHITLTDSGMEIAQRIYERHTFLSAWLASLGVDVVVAAEDACRMEHVISAETLTPSAPLSGPISPANEPQRPPDLCVRQPLFYSQAAVPRSG